MVNTRFATRWSKIQILPRSCAISLFCASVFYAGIALYTPAGQADDQQKLKSIQQDIASKERLVRQQQSQRSSLMVQLKDQEKTIAAASELLRSMQGELTELGQQIQVLQASVNKLEHQQRQQKQELSTQLDAAFRLGQHSGIQALLMGEDSLRDQRIQVYYQYLSRARRESITRLQQTQQQLAERKQQAEIRQASQQRLFKQQKNQQARLEQARNERQKIIKQLDASIQQGQQQISELRRNEARLRDSIARAQAAARQQAEREARAAGQVRARQQEASRKGSSYAPSESEKALMARTGGLGKPQGQAYWPVKGALLHRYSDIIQGELRWKGIVIAASAGTEVRAIADGRVILVDWLQGYGLVIVLEHGKGDMSLYGYNQSAQVKVGDLVQAGKPIARVGDSGGQGQPALYFEIRRQGQAVNPLPWLYAK